MPTYVFNWSYEAYRDGTRYGPWESGAVVHLDAPDADWVERDSPGALSKVDAAADAANPVPALGARPRVNGDPDRADVAAEAQERVHAESVHRGTAPPPDAVTVEPAEEVAEESEVDEPASEEPADAKKPARNRQHTTGKNRAAK